ncbi:hypothetical protein OV450_7668, partial [Actinobacteria bacterium OV450]
MRYDDRPPSPESASSVSPERRWFARRSGLAVGAAVLAPTALAGWVLVQLTTGAGADDARPPPIVMPAASASTSPPPPPPSSAS